MIQNQLRVKEPDIQEDTYSQFREYLEYPPYVSRKGMEAVLADIGDKDAGRRRMSNWRISSTCALLPSWIKRAAVSRRLFGSDLFAEGILR